MAKRKVGNDLAGQIATWEARGHRVRFDAKGRPVFIIRRQIDGKRFEVSTRAHTLAAALAQEERFQRNPQAYRPGGHEGGDPVYLDKDIRKAFLAWSLKVRGNSASWVKKQDDYLSWWAKKLEGVNLRNMAPRDHIIPAVEKATARRSRLAVLKAFFSYLRKERHILKSAEDATIDIPIPQAKPSQWTKSKIIPRDHFDLVLEYLRADEASKRAKREAARRAGKVVPLAQEQDRDAPWADALALQAGTGWHTTEIVRFAADGSIEPAPQHLAQEGVAGVVVCPLRKSGEMQRTRVGPIPLEAAKKLRAHGAISREWYDRAVRAACKAVKLPVPRDDGTDGIPVFTPGTLRHSVASWAIEAGADPASVAAFLGHRSPRTTMKFYAVHSSPKKVPTLL
jgi:integrase